MDELGGKTLEHIDTTAGQNIDIVFGAGPAQQAAERALFEASPLWNREVMPMEDIGRDNPLMGN